MGCTSSAAPAVFDTVIPTVFWKMSLHGWLRISPLSTKSHPFSMTMNAGLDPYLSIIIPAYNAQATLEACLTSILHSSFQDWELIVVDDGSSDQTPEVIRRYPARLVSLQDKGGPASARNSGASAPWRGAIFYGCRLCPPPRYADAGFDCTKNQSICEYSLWLL